MVSGGMDSASAKYVSSTNAGVVDIYTMDDNSGKQQFRFI
jgi:hypothetical protein